MDGQYNRFYSIDLLGCPPRASSFSSASSSSCCSFSSSLPSSSSINFSPYSWSSPSSINFSLYSWSSPSSLASQPTPTGSPARSLASVGSPDLWTPGLVNESGHKSGQHAGISPRLPHKLTTGLVDSWIWGSGLLALLRTPGLPRTRSHKSGTRATNHMALVEEIAPGLVDLCYF